MIFGLERGTRAKKKKKSNRCLSLSLSPSFRSSVPASPTTRIRTLCMESASEALGTDAPVRDDHMENEKKQTKKKTKRKFESKQATKSEEKSFVFFLLVRSTSQHSLRNKSKRHEKKKKRPDRNTTFCLYVGPHSDLPTGAADVQDSQRVSLREERVWSR